MHNLSVIIFRNFKQIIIFQSLNPIFDDVEINSISSSPHPHVGNHLEATSGGEICMVHQRVWYRVEHEKLPYIYIYSLRPHKGPGFDSPPSENEYQEYILGVKAAGA